jgi:hypothetical protein
VGKEEAGEAGEAVGEGKEGEAEEAGEAGEAGKAGGEVTLRVRRGREVVVGGESVMEGERIKDEGRKQQAMGSFNA